MEATSDFSSLFDEAAYLDAQSAWEERSARIWVSPGRPEALLYASDESLQIVGPTGTGKSSLLERYAADCRVPRDFLLSGSGIPRTKEEIWRWHKHHQCELLLIDDCDRADAANIVSFVGPTLRKGGRVVLAGRESPQIPTVSTVQMEPLTKGRAREIVYRRLSIIRAEEVARRMSQEIAELCSELTTPRALLVVASRCLNTGWSPRELLKKLPGLLYDCDLPARDEPPAPLSTSRAIYADSIGELTRELKKQPHSLFDLPPRRFEEVVAELLRGKGCEVQLTPASRDGGFDIFAFLPTPLGSKLCIVEAKRHRRKVGVELVRQLYGTFTSVEAACAMLVTTSSFTAGAKRFRERHRFVLDLADYFDLAEWINSYDMP